jgi:hypothetical protein
VKRALTLILSLATAVGGLWMINATHSLNSACILSAQSGAGGSCVSGLPFYLTGMALTAIGVVCLIVTLISSLRTRLDKSARVEPSIISVLPQHETESLRDVA